MSSRSVGGASGVVGRSIWRCVPLPPEQVVWWNTSLTGAAAAFHLCTRSVSDGKRAYLERSPAFSSCVVVALGFVGRVSSRMTGHDREARDRVPRRPVDVAMVEIAQVHVEVPWLGVEICPRIRRHSAGGYA